MVKLPETRDRLVRWLLRRLFGRTATVGAFDWLHRAALAGLGFGASQVDDTGEAAVITSCVPKGEAIVFDVGANRGAWSTMVLQRRPDARLHAFEPAADVFEELAATLGDRATCVLAALSDTAGEATLYGAPGLDILSSLHDRDLGAHGLEMTATERVAVVTMDDYCEQADITQIALLKIDAEGHDLAVLRGAERLLRRGAINAVQFEFGGANLDSRTYLRDFVQLLEPAYAVHRVLKDGLVPLRLTERQEVFLTANYLALRRDGQSPTE